MSIDRMHGKVTVMGSVSQKKVLRAARRSGRLAVLWPSAYSNPAHHHSYAQPPPAAAYYPNHYQAKAVQALAQPQQHYYFSSVPRGSKNGGVSTVARTPVAQYPQQGKASSYNYHVHGYYNSELYGNYNEQHAVVPAGVGNYFSDENPTGACSIM